MNIMLKTVAYTELILNLNNYSIKFHVSTDLNENKGFGSTRF